jgi:Carboxypeptidase regulatory-like domain/TonB dependent receptor-like, beta-barrel/TonB-dependent Receptor Plug Domain
MRRCLLLLVVAAAVLLPRIASTQGLTGALIGTVKDVQSGVLPGAVVSVSSPALIGGPSTVTTNEKGQLRFAALPPGPYVLDISMQGFTTYHEEDVRIGAGATIERTAVLKLGGLAESVVVEGAGSRVEARGSGFGTRFGPEDIKAIPTRRSSMFDLIGAAPGISATSPGTGGNSLVSAFGSGANENTFLIDGTNFTSPANGVARAEPGVDFIQEVHVQSVGASAEFGNMQGAVVNVVTRQGSDRFLYDASYYAQPAGLTSQPVRLLIPGAGQLASGYERARYRDFTTNLGGPVVRERLWFFAGYQYLRDYDSQPGTDPNFPRTYEQNKIFAKLTWRLAPAWQLVQSVHDEHWVNPELPTSAKPFEATLYQHASVPAITFGHLTHTLSGNTMWDVRVGRFVFSQESSPSSGNRGTPSRMDSGTGVTSGAPQQVGAGTQIRSTAKATLSHYRPDLLGADHEWKIGGQFDQGENRALLVIPTGTWYLDNNGRPSQSTSRDPANAGGQFITAAAFASDAVTVGSRLTINAGLRFDHSRAVSQDLPALGADGHETGEVIRGLGTMYTWNVLSPRLGVTAKLSADGRTVLRASYGRFNQGVLTGELAPLHPGQTPVTTKGFDPATGGYTRIISIVDPKRNLQLDPAMRATRTDEYSIGADREIGRRIAIGIAYVRKNGANFIGWTDIGGEYRGDTRTLADGSTLPVSVLVNSTAARRFLLTNPDDYSLTYNGLVTVIEKRRSHGWQAFGSYTLSRAYGLQAYSGTNAAGPQVSTIGAPPGAFSSGPITFGRDPNDLTNASGRLPNDRPHMFRAMGSADVARTGFVFAANLQISSGKPWAATTVVSLPQNNQQRILIESRGSRRLSSQSLLDLRVSRTIAIGGVGHIELLLDVLNALNDTAEEGLATDNMFSSNFGQPTVFVDPRRVMVSVRVNLGR